MTSPQILAGLGEPILQLRELIKDLHHRNAVERSRAELDLISDQVDRAIQFGLLRSERDVRFLFASLVRGQSYSESIAALSMCPGAPLLAEPSADTAVMLNSKLSPMKRQARIISVGDEHEKSK